MQKRKPDDVRKLNAADVRWTCNPSQLTFGTTADLDPPDALIGQTRAERSLEFGVDIKSPGFNIYAAGIPGTGRTSMIVERLREEAAKRPVPDDWCYVHNFDDNHRPRALRLPAGTAPIFSSQMADVVETLVHEIPRAFETDEYRDRRDHITQSVQNDQRKAFHKLEQQASAVSFGLIQSPTGLTVAPITDGKPMSPAALNAMSAAEREQLEATSNKLEAEVTRTTRWLRTQEREARDAIPTLDRDVARSIARPLLDDLRDHYAELPPVVAHVDAIEQHVIQNYGRFLESGKPDKSSQRPHPAGDPLLPYRINVLVTHAPPTGAPLVRDGHPTHPRLFGQIETRSEFGVTVTDFTMIRPGTLHRANGGYLVLEIEDVLQMRLSYEALKRALRDQIIRIGSAADDMGLQSMARLDPEPIPLDVKVALVGPPDVYAMLYEHDPDFGELFKVLAEFETEIDLDDGNITRYAQFVAARCVDENLLHFDESAVAQIVEEGVRIAADQTKISTRFGDISDIIRESEYWARQRGGKIVTQEDVWASIDERTRRSNLLETRIRDRMSDGTILIDLDGAAIGQINGLSVLGVGAHTFGQPNRITARVFSGRDGVISVDRETKMTGPIHDKGAMILAGFLNGQFGTVTPLTMSASITFEQSYGGIEGDSASLAELLALLSALTESPLLQGIAVTGSVNQHGEVQAVGGVTRKVEGFYDLCERHGLTDQQGVLIPDSNVRNLSLRRDVAQAVSEGRFHVYATATVDGAIELLMERTAGQRDATGQFNTDTVYGQAQSRLARFARRLHDGPHS